jgi:hypothetical protein
LFAAAGSKAGIYYLDTGASNVREVITGTAIHK